MKLCRRKSVERVYDLLAHVSHPGSFLQILPLARLAEPKLAEGERRLG
jgi:hypothetical protein